MATREEFTWPGGKELAISVSFDDARPSQLDAAVPILNRHQCRATFFVIPRTLEARAPEWRRAAEQGHELGNHSVHHPCSANYPCGRKYSLESYTLDRMEEEIVQCNARVEALCGVAPETFAYPCGHTFVGRGEETQSYVPLVAKHFAAGRGYPGEHHNYPPLCDLAQLNGRPFDEKSLEEILDWIEDARNERGWLVLAGHDVREDEAYQAVPAETLNAVCAYAADPENAVLMDTVGSVARYVAQWQEGARTL